MAAIVHRVSKFSRMFFTFKRLLLTRKKCCPVYNSLSTHAVEDLRARNVVEQIFPEEGEKLQKLFESGVQCAYAGFDPTADSLHVGNLAIIMGLLHWVRTGHKAIALIGGATAQIGDPSGRSTEREASVKDVIYENGEKINSQLKNLFNNYNQYFNKGQHTGPIRILNNISWYKDYNIVEFLSTVGKSFKIGEMLSRTSVQSRLNSRGGISFCEFSYQVFQTYDWLHLLKNHNCHFQFGGMDQTGNIHGGRDVIVRTTKKPVFGLMLPLLLTEFGDKFGKSAGNAVWLDPDKSSPFELYQHFLRIPDKSVQSYAPIFLLDSMEDIEEFMKIHLEDTGKILAQKRLAEQVTLLVHGESGLESAKLCTEALFHASPETLGKLSKEQLSYIFQQASTIRLPFQNDLPIIDLAMKARCFPHLIPAAQIIKSGGFYINGVKSTDAKSFIKQDEHLLPNGITVLRVGKKNHHLVIWS